MKKQLVSNSTRTMLSRFAFGLFLLLNLTQASASPFNKGEEPYLNITYIGSEEQKVLFQVDLVNDNEEAYLFTIQDEDGLVLYKEKVNKKTFTKKFQWDNAEFNASKLMFSVTGEKSKKTQLFEVNAQVRTIRDVVITKL